MSGAPAWRQGAAGPASLSGMPSLPIAIGSRHELTGSFLPAKIH